MSKLFKIGILVFTLIILIMGCTESNVEETPEGSDQNIADDGTTEGPTDEPAEEPSGGVFAVGDTADFDGLKITLNGVRTSQGDEYFPPENDKFILIDLTIENTTNEAQTVSTLMQMSLMDPESFAYDVAIFADTKGSVDGEIAPGRKVRGEVAFDVPQADFYEFIFEDPFVGGQAIWKLENIQ